MSEWIWYRELALFVLIGLGTPIIAGVVAGVVLRTRRPDWSVPKKAWIAGLPIPLLQILVAVWFAVGSYTSFQECPPESVCDMPALGLGIAIMLAVVAAIAYVLAAVAAYLALRRA